MILQYAIVSTHVGDIVGGPLGVWLGVKDVGGFVGGREVEGDRVGIVDGDVVGLEDG
jgi:hypothetical protein